MACIEKLCSHAGGFLVLTLTSSLILLESSESRNNQERNLAAAWTVDFSWAQYGTLSLNNTRHPHLHLPHSKTTLPRWWSIYVYIQNNIWQLLYILPPPSHHNHNSICFILLIQLLIDISIYIICAAVSAFSQLMKTHGSKCLNYILVPKLYAYVVMNQYNITNLIFLTISWQTKRLLRFVTY